jgi:hypothetical protein
LQDLYKENKEYITAYYDKYDDFGDEISRLNKSTNPIGIMYEDFAKLNNAGLKDKLKGLIVQKNLIDDGIENIDSDFFTELQFNNQKWPINYQINRITRYAKDLIGCSQLKIKRLGIKKLKIDCHIQTIEHLNKAKTIFETQYQITLTLPKHLTKLLDELKVQSKNLEKKLQDCNEKLKDAVKFSNELEDILQEHEIAREQLKDKRNKEREEKINSELDSLAENYNGDDKEEKKKELKVFLTDCKNGNELPKETFNMLQKDNSWWRILLGWILSKILQQSYINKLDKRSCWKTWINHYKFSGLTKDLNININSEQTLIK